MNKIIELLLWLILIEKFKVVMDDWIWVYEYNNWIKYVLVYFLYGFLYYGDRVRGFVVLLLDVVGWKIIY